MKRLFFKYTAALLSIMLIGMTIPSGGFMETASEFRIDRIDIGGDFLYTADEEGVWIVQKDQVYFYAGDSYEKEAVAVVSNIISITPFSGDLYVMTTGNDLFQYQIHRLNWEGLIQETWNVSASFPVKSFVVVNEQHAIFLISDGQGVSGDGYLVVFDFGSEQILPLDIYDFYNYDIDHISPVEKDKFLSSTGETSDIFQINIETHSYELLSLMNTNIIASTAGLGDGFSFHLTDNGIESTNMAEKQFGIWMERSKLVDDESDILTDIQRGGTTLYVKDQTQGALICIEHIDMRNQPYTGSLTFVMPGYWNNTQTDQVADTKFHEMHPDVELLFKDYPYERFTTALMANERGLDMFVTGGGSLNRIEMATFIKAGILANVLEHPGIAKNLEEWIDLSSVLGYDNGIYGIPMYQKFYCNLFFINPIIAQRIGIETPARDWTFKDMYSLYDKVAAYNEQNDKNIAFLIDFAYMPLLSRHLLKNGIDPIGGTTAIDTPEFAEFLEWWKTGSNDGLIIQWRTAPNFTGDEETLFWASEELFAYMKGKYAIYPPTIHETDRYPIRPIVYAANANSENLEYALDYLECLTSPEAQYAEPIEWSQPLLKNIDGYAPYYGEQLYTNYISGYPFPYDQRQLFVDLIENGVDDSVYDFEWDVGDMIIAYVNGEIELEEILHVTQQKADMMLGE